MGKVIVKLKGGLGNQLFQYAAAYSFSREFSCSLSFDLSLYALPKFQNVYRLNQYPLEVNELTRLEYENLERTYLQIKKNNIFRRLLIKLKMYSFFDNLIVNESNLNAIRTYSVNKSNKNQQFIFDDWFINPSFFLSQRAFFQEVFVPKKLDNSSEQLLNKIRNSNSVSVHVRRGDYVGNPYFNNLDDEYYLPAIKLISEKLPNPVFYFFSNDPSYVKEHFSFLENKVVVEVNSESLNEFSTKGDVLDLYLMSNCKAQIIANSSFSWWGAFLNKHAQSLAVAPKTWYLDKEAQSKYEQNGLILSNWIKV